MMRNSLWVIILILCLGVNLAAIAEQSDDSFDTEEKPL